MTQLSPEAQAVRNAYTRAADAVSETDRSYMTVADAAGVAAALRAAAMRTLLTSEHYEGLTPDDYELGWNAAVAYIQNIATELGWNAAVAYIQNIATELESQ